MKVAIAGPGEIAHYLLEELPKRHEVVVLTRNKKDWIESLNINQMITNYSVETLSEQLANCDALISTLCIYDMSNVTLHMNLLEACKKSSKCKKFIPAEFGANIEDYPDQPAFYYENHEPIRQALREQQDVKYTMICNGWFMDYVVPPSKRYIKDAGDIWPMNYDKKQFTMYGKGTQTIDLTSARDMAKAVSELLDRDDWEPFTFVSGQQISWKSLYGILKSRDPAWSIKPLSLVQSVQRIVANESEWDVIQGWFEVYGFSDVASNKERIEEQRKKYFGNVKFRTVEEFLDEAEAVSDKAL